MKGTHTIKITVDDAAKSVIKTLAKQYHMKEQEVSSAVYVWFGRQDDIYQRAVLGLLEGLRVDAAKEYMRRWAKNNEAREPVITSGGSDVPTTPAKQHEELPADENGRKARGKPK